MPEVLSQKQIDELLGSLQSGNTNIQEIEEHSSNQKVKEYDFRSPKKFTREQLKLLSNIFENFSRLFSLYLSSILRVACQIEIVQVEEEEYREFNNALDDSVLVGIIGLGNAELNLDDKEFLLEMARPLSFTILDRLLGGDGSGYNVERDYTEIELSIMEYLFQQLVPYLKNAWSNYAEIEHILSRLETNSRLIQIIPPDESVVIIVMEMMVRDVKGNINICLSASVLDSLFKLFDARMAKTDSRMDSEAVKERRDLIMNSLADSPLVITGVLGKTEIVLQDLLELQVGDIIPLDSSAKGSSIIANVDEVPWFEGSLGVRKKKYAIKVERVIK